MSEYAHETCRVEVEYAVLRLAEQLDKLGGELTQARVVATALIGRKRLGEGLWLYRGSVPYEMGVGTVGYGRTTQCGQRTGGLLLRRHSGEVDRKEKDARRRRNGRGGKNKRADTGRGALVMARKCIQMDE